MRIALTAISAVSLVMPRLTQPALTPTSYAVRHHLAELFVRQVVRVDAMRIAFGTIIAAAIFEVDRDVDMR